MSWSQNYELLRKLPLWRSCYLSCSMEVKPHGNRKRWLDAVTFDDDHPFLLCGGRGYDQLTQIIFKMLNAIDQLNYPYTATNPSLTPITVTPVHQYPRTSRVLILYSLFWCVAGKKLSEIPQQNFSEKNLRTRNYDKSTSLFTAATSTAFISPLLDMASP